MKRKQGNDKKTTIILVIMALVLGSLFSFVYYYFSSNDKEAELANEIKPIEEKVPHSYRKDFTEGEICGWIRKQKNIENKYTCSDPQKTIPTEGIYKDKEIWDVLYSKEDSDDPKDTFSYIADVASGNILEGPIYYDTSEDTEPLE